LPGATLNKFKWKGNNALPIFLICVLISVVFWILYSLNKTFTYPVKYSLAVTNIPYSKRVINDIPDKATITVRARGFELLWFLLGREKKEMVIDVNSYHASDDIVYVGLLPVFQSRLRANNSSFEIISTAPDSLVLFLSVKYVKKVPVKADITYDIRKNFGLYAEPYTTPDSVFVSGEKSIVDTISSIKTQPAIYKSLDNDTRSTLTLISPSKDVRLSEKSVSLVIPVDEFIEKNITLPVSYKQPGARKILLIPDHVKITYKVPLKYIDTISEESFGIKVSPKSFLEEGRLAIEISSKPLHTTVSTIIPSTVDCYIEK
jgi:hypothetical protein